MSNEVNFEEDNFNHTTANNSQGGLSEILISYGLVRTKQQAGWVMLGVVVVAVLISLFFFSKGFSNSGLENPSNDLINAPQPRGPIN